MRIAKSIADVQVRSHVTGTVAIGVKIEALRSPSEAGLRSCQ